jgi:YD repeat-containing protein
MIAWPWRDVAELHGVKVHSDDLLGDLNAWGTKVLELDELDEQALAWERLQRFKSAVALIESLLAPRMHENIPRKPGWADTPAGVFKRSWRGTKWTWDDQGARSAVIDHALENREPNPETGELEPPEKAVVRHLFEAMRVNYWLVGGLRDRGIDPDEFRDRQDGTPWVAPA